MIPSLILSVFLTMAHFSAFYPITGMPEECLALTRPIPKGKFLMAGSGGRAVMVESPEVVPSVTTGEAPEDSPLFLAAYILVDPRTGEITVLPPIRPIDPQCPIDAQPSRPS